MQAAWIIAIPAFRGIDEFDHAYRSASVGSGNWSPATEAAENGRGRLVSVPRALVEAARDQCAEYEYTGPDNCQPVHSLGQGEVAVASAATDQPPTVYALFGYPSMIAEGAASLYVMRTVSAIICTAMLGLAVWCVTKWARGPWPLMALFTATTPVVVYSTILPAGNGIEAVSGIALWAALVGLSRVRDVESERILLLAAATPMALLCGLRQLGPVMALGVTLVIIVLLGRTRFTALVRTQRASVVWLGAVAIMSASSQAIWVAVASGYPAGSTDHASGPQDPSTAPSNMDWLILWIAQSFAAFPTRNETAPAIVYEVLVGGSAILWIWGLWRARGRVRMAIILITGLSALLPFMFTTLAWERSLWQGRYGVALAAGCFMIVGLVLDGVGTRPQSRWIVACLGGIGSMHVVSILGVSRTVLATVHPSFSAVLMILGWATVCIVVAANYRAPRVDSANFIPRGSG